MCTSNSTPRSTYTLSKTSPTQSDSKRRRCPLTGITAGHTSSRGKCFTSRLALATVDEHPSRRINAYLYSHFAIFFRLSIAETFQILNCITNIFGGRRLVAKNSDVVHFTRLMPRTSRHLEAVLSNQSTCSLSYLFITLTP